MPEDDGVRTLNNDAMEMGWRGGLRHENIEQKMNGVRLASCLQLKRPAKTRIQKRNSLIQVILQNKNIFSFVISGTGFKRGHRFDKCVLVNL